MQKETFSFVDRNDLKTSMADVREKIIEAGLLYPKYKPEHKAALLWHLETGLALSPDRKLVSQNEKPFEIDHISKQI